MVTLLDWSNEQLKEISSVFPVTSAHVTKVVELVSQRFLFQRHLPVISAYMLTLKMGRPDHWFIANSTSEMVVTSHGKKTLEKAWEIATDKHLHGEAVS